MSEPVAFRTRYVFPVSAPPIPGGYVSIADGRITSVDHRPPDQPAEDLGDVAIVPAFVNAHTHLEFSHLTSPLGTPGMEFADWLRLLVAHRHQREAERDSGDDDAQVAIDKSITSGLKECAEGGATHVGEIAARRDVPYRYESYETDAAHVTVFHELLGLSADDVGQHLEGARRHLHRMSEREAGMQPGISPHAPYTVHPELLQGAVRLSAEAKAPLAMHLAESSSELELLASHAGPLVDFLTEMGVWDPTAVPRGIRPLDYLQQLTAAHRALIVHGNFLDHEELDLLASHCDKMSLVYCPRTHAYFHHGDYNLAERLAAGVNVCLGTDSRASNPDLSMFSEMTFAAARHPQVAPRNILEMATLAGATALGLDAHTGSVQAGKAADLTVLRIPEGETDDPHELLFDPTSAVEAVYRAGRRVFPN